MTGSLKGKESWPHEFEQCVKLDTVLLLAIPDLITLNVSPMKIAPTISAIYGFDRKSDLKRPLFACGVSAGFPSPADDYIQGRLDLNELMIQHPAATFFVRVSGDSMIGAGIHHDDILVVDRSLDPASGKVVIAVVNGDLTVKRLFNFSAPAMPTRRSGWYSWIWFQPATRRPIFFIPHQRGRNRS